MTYFVLSAHQKVLFYTAIATVIVQSICVYYFIENKANFKIENCLGYLFFSCIAFFYYYKMAV